MTDKYRLRISCGNRVGTTYITCGHSSLLELRRFITVLCGRFDSVSPIDNGFRCILDGLVTDYQLIGEHGGFSTLGGLVLVHGVTS